MPDLRLKNTLTKSVEPFVPLDPQGKDVTIYTCGPTVYSYAHIGNFRSFLMADILRRVLERQGYRVRQVMNITDVGHMTQDHLADASGEDKLSRAARELGWDPYKVAEHFESAFVADAKALGLAIYTGSEAQRAELHPRATAHVPEMLVMIQTLLERGFAYLDNKGQAYFEVAKFPEYGSLSGKVLEDLEAGSRVAVREEKKDPRDFALWKVDDKHLMQWDPHGPAGWPPGDYERFRSLCPAGVDARLRPGFPGWHIECSAMARAHLGALIDIHTGGEDNIFPHHECEMARSFGASEGKNPPVSFAKVWVHGRHLLVDNKKMSKSEGTFFTVRDLMAPRDSGREDLAKKLEEVGFEGGRVPARVLRYALISNHYLQPMNFGFDLLAQSKSSVERIQSRYDRLREIAGEGAPSAEVKALLEKRTAEFDAALSDNLTMPNALAALFELVSDLNLLQLAPGDAQAAKSTLESFDGVLGVLDRSSRSGILTKEEVAARAAGSLPNFDDVLACTTTDQSLVENMIVLRHVARTARDFKKADVLRDELKRRGVLVDDLPQGVRWKLA